MLFEDGVTWPVFVIIQCLHFFNEWFMYGLRFNSFFYRMVDYLPNCLNKFKAILVMPGLSFPEWQVLLVLEFAIRVWISLTSAVVCGIVLYTVSSS